jgi:hypothetical protein
MASLCDDLAVAHVEKVCVGAIDILVPQIWQEMPAYLSPHGYNRAEAGQEVVHQEELKAGWDL